MDNWLKNPWAIRFISLVLAILLYVAVNITQNPDSEDRTFPSNGNSQTERLSSIPVEILMDEEEDYVVSGIPENVVVDLEGANSAITPIIRQSTLDVYADLREYGPGVHEVELQYSGAAENVEVYIEPSTVEAIIEERAVEEFTVEIDYLNESQMGAGYEVAAAAVEPETVTIASSESVVESVEAVKAYVNLEGAEASIEEREVPVNVYDSQGNELDVRVEPETVLVSVELQNPNKEVPVDITTTGELAEGLVLNSVTANPSEVTVFASEETLQDVTEISTEPINLSQVTESGEMEVSLEVPAGIRAIDRKQVSITMEIDEVDSSTFEDIEIEAQNLDEEQTMRFANEEASAMEVKVFGRKDELSELTANDIRLSVDLREAVLGTQSVPVEADVTGDLLTELEYDSAEILIE